jgi:ArsR family metal-binding transcriptional regulator
MKLKKIIEIKEDISLKQKDKRVILEKGDKIIVIKESEDPDLRKVADIADNAEGLYGLKAPLQKVFGKGNVDFYGSSVLMVKTKKGRKIMIASPANVETDGSEIIVQGGKLVVGYA